MPNLNKMVPLVYLLVQSCAGCTHTDSLNGLLIYYSLIPKNGFGPSKHFLHVKYTSESKSPFNF